MGRGHPQPDSCPAPLGSDCVFSRATASWGPKATASPSGRGEQVSSGRWEVLESSAFDAVSPVSYSFDEARVGHEPPWAPAAATCLFGEAACSFGEASCSFGEAGCSFGIASGSKWPQ